MRHLHAILALLPLAIAPACAASPASTPDTTPSEGGAAGDADVGADSDHPSDASPAASDSGAGSSDAHGADSSTQPPPGDSGTGHADADAGAAVDSAAGCGMPLCDDFESDTLNAPPSSALWTLIGTKGCGGVGNPSAATVYPIVVDGAMAHSGSKSVKVVGGDSCGPLMVHTSAFAQLSGGEVYGRFYVHLSDTTTTFDHTALMALGLKADAGGGINIGDQSSYLQLASEGAGNATNVLMWQTSDGDILPAKNSMGGAQSVYPTATGWTCIEFHTSASSGALETWVNGASVAGLTFVPGTTVKVPSVNDEWTPPSPFAPVSLGFGWLLFSGPAMTLWFDDIALNSTRIGCP